MAEPAPDLRLLAKQLIDAARVGVAAAAVEAIDQPHPLAPWLVDWHELWSHDEDDADRWLVEPFVARGRAHALYAGAKTGKSWVVLYVCACLATGRAVLGRPAGEPVPVLYVDYEMTQADLADRLTGFGFGPEDDLSRLHYVLLPSIPGLDRDGGGTLIVQAAAAVGAELVVVDTTARAVEGDENDADTYRAFYRHTGLGLKALGVAWMRLDHAGKDAEKGQRGSSAKNDDVDLVLRLDRVDGGVTVKATHRRVGWYPERSRFDVIQGDEATVIRLAAESVKTWPSGTQDVAALLDGLEEPVDISTRHATKVLREAGHRHRNEVIRAAVAWRKEAGRAAGRALFDAIAGAGSGADADNASDLPGARSGRAGARYSSPSGARPVSIDTGAHQGQDDENGPTAEELGF